MLIGVVPDWIGPRAVVSSGQKLLAALRGVFASRSAAKGAYEIAKSGGRHSGLYRNYVGRSTQEIQGSLRSFEANVAEHADKLANPQKYVHNWADLTKAKQEGLRRVWQQHLTRNQEQADIMRGILRER